MVHNHIPFPDSNLNVLTPTTTQIPLEKYITRIRLKMQLAFTRCDPNSKVSLLENNWFVDFKRKTKSKTIVFKKHWDPNKSNKNAYM